MKNKGLAQIGHIVNPNFKFIRHKQYALIRTKVMNKVTRRERIVGPHKPVFYIVRDSEGGVMHRLMFNNGSTIKVSSAEVRAK